MFSTKPIQNENRNPDGTLKSFQPANLLKAARKFSEYEANQALAKRK